MWTDKINLILAALRQPSTVKGILGLAVLAGLNWKPEGYETVVDGLAVVYMLIAIFWQKS